MNKLFYVSVNNKILFQSQTNTGLFPACTTQYDATTNAIGHITKVAMHHSATLLEYDTNVTITMGR